MVEVKALELVGTPGSVSLCSLSSHSPSAGYHMVMESHHVLAP